MVDTKKNETRPPSFAAMLAQIRPGTDIEAAEMLRNVVSAVVATGKVGSLVVRIDVKPSGTGQDSVDVFDRLTQKIPEKTRVGARAFITEEGDLSRSDPSAMPLFDDQDIRDAGARVDYSTGEVKEAPEA